MKKLLFLSLGLNLLLGVWFVAGAAKQPSHQETAETEKAAEAMAETGSDHSDSSGLEFASEPSDPVSFHWSFLVDEDLAVYAENLRALRCPESRVKLVIQAELAQRFKPRIFTVASSAQQKFYEIMANVRSGLSDLAPDAQEQLGKLDEEMQAQLREALESGKSPTAERSAPDAERVAHFEDLLSVQQAEQVIAIRDEFTRKKDAANRERNRKELISDLNAMEQHQLRYVVSEEQLAELNLRFALPGSFKRERATFPATAGEWRHIAELQLMATQTNASPAEVENQIAQILGPERGQQFKRHKEHNFREFAELTDEAGLPEEIAIACDNLRKEAENQKSELKKTPLPGPLKDQLMTNWRAETTTALQSLLGEENTAAYLDRCGHWLKRH